jgi:hypothetical protein
MAKKRPVPKKAPKSAKPAKAAKAAKPAGKQGTNGPAGPSAVVVFTLRDSGASPLRFHSEHQDLSRAKGIALALVNSPDVADAFVLHNVEVVRRAGMG